MFLVAPHLASVSYGNYTIGFADGYDTIANNLIHGNGYRLQAGMAETMIREPGYPLLLAAVFLVGGYNIEAARFANWLLMIGVAFMLVRLAKMVTDDDRTALLASLLFVFYPGALMAEARGGVEILFVFVSLAFILALHRALKTGSLFHYFVAGLLFGAVLEVRGTPIAFPVLLLLYLGMAAKGTLKRVRVAANVAILGIGMVIVAAPWVIRNYSLVHQFVPGGSIRGIALQGGQFTCRNLSLADNYKVVLNESKIERAALAEELGLEGQDLQYALPLFYDAKDELRLSNVLLNQGMEEYRNDPAFFASCAVENAFFYFFLGKTWLVTGLNMLVQVPFLILAASGLYVLKRQARLDQMAVMLIFVLSILIVHFVTIGEARYSVPVFAFLAIPASVSLVSMWQRYKLYGRHG